MTEPRAGKPETVQRPSEVTVDARGGSQRDAGGGVDFDAVRDGAAQAFNDPDAPAGSVEMMMRLRCIQLGRCAIRLRQLAKVAEAACCTVQQAGGGVDLSDG